MTALHVDAPPSGVDERTYWADRVWRPWIERVKPLSDATVLEYGCGPGSVSRAFAPHVKRHIGLDIDAGYIATARRLAAAGGHDNSEFHLHPPEEIADALRGFAGTIDVVLLYAVLEHLTIAERLDVLEAARDVARPDGVIAVIELPNRLVTFDHHSSWLPFVTQLPDELALDYLRDAERPELRDEVLAVRDPSVPAAEDAAALLALRRFGRGMSFHEFELAWGGRIDGHALATNWEPEVIPHREVDPGEVALARTIARLRPEMDPCWSRQWIDVILAPDLPLKRGPFHRPWAGSPGPASRLVGRGLDDAIFLRSAEAALHVELPEATRRVALRVVDGEDRTVVHATSLLGERVEGVSTGRPGHARTVVLDLPGWSDDLMIRLPRGGWILALTYVGFGPG
jgi:SAM-dependent methyltransferase